MKNLHARFAAAAAVVSLLFSSPTILAQGATAFTYQGQLNDGGTNANGIYTMIFALYDAASGGDLIGGPVTTSPTLANGLFTVNLDFGLGAFNGSGRWLDITISSGGVTQGLSPRVQVLPSPYALYAAVAATVTNGAIMNAQIAANAIATTNIQNSAITTAQIANGAVTNANLTANAVAATNIQNGAITDSKIAALTSLLSTYGSETNLRVVRGSMWDLNNGAPVVGANSGTNYTNFGSGYTATYYPPGSGGNLVGYYTVATVTNNGTGDYVFTWVGGGINNGGVNNNAWIVANGGGPDSEILQVQSVNANGFTTYGEGCGVLSNNPYNEVWVNPRLSSEWDITFTTPFSGIPTIIVASGGGNDNASRPGIVPWVTAPFSAIQATDFAALVDYNITDGSTFCWPYYGDGFAFIAIGPK